MKRELKIAAALLILLVLTVSMASVSAPAVYASDGQLEREDWDSFTKESLNTFMATYGAKAAGGNPYVVFDFDNTCSIFDIEEQLAIYQLQTMAFAITPEQLPGVLRTGLSDLNKDLTDLGYGNGSYNDWIADITAAYEKLWATYGPFTAAGLSDEDRFAIRTDDNWKEFATKMRAMYDLVAEKDPSAAYPWILYWFTGMTEQEVYDLATRSHNNYRTVKTSSVTWTSPETVPSRTGVVKCTWTSGVQVTENIRELWKSLKESGFDIWVCSASGVDPVCAAVDVWDMHQYVSGVIAMTIATSADNRFINQYDYTSGTYKRANADGTWSKGDLAIKALTQGIGKVNAINNTLFVRYGHGPVAGFMDSTGDFNFCTEYDSLKIVVCFNRANRGVTDGGGLVSEVAIYEKDTLGYDLLSANAAGDTLYVLQGRDENGLRTLRASDKTLIFGSTTEKLFKNEENESQLQYMITNRMSVRDITNTFAINTAKEESVLGFRYGFLNEYSGYHNIK